MREDRDPDHVPIIHPNGFIQLKLLGGLRMHFWHPEIPRQRVYSPIHDHVFDMASEILLGRLCHCEIEVIVQPDGYYMIWEAVPTRDSETTLMSTDVRVRAERHMEQEFRPGDHYTFGAFSFHATRDSEPAVSVIRKKQTYQGRPRVLVPAGSKPDNDWVRDEFTTTFVEEFMFRVVEESR